MAKYEDLLKEFNIEDPEKKKRDPKPNPKQSSGNSGAGSQINTGKMKGVFGGGNSTAKQGNNPYQNQGGSTSYQKSKRSPRTSGSHIDWQAVGARLRALPYAVIICSVISIIMGLYIVINFDAVTWKIFCFIYNLISAGLVIFVLIVIILVLILALRRPRRWW